MAQSLRLFDVLRALEARAPSGTAEAWDNVGLLVGDPNWETSRAVVSIDLTSEALDLAEKHEAKLIVTHHPCIFPRSQGLSRVVPGLVFRAVRQGIGVIACHTNFDRSALEVVESVARALGAVPRGRLHDQGGGDTAFLKLVTFVPQAQVDAVRNAICEAGAGRIGKYDFCSFGVAGEGTFRGDSGTKPFVGAAGQRETAAEIRLETIFPRGLEQQVVGALRASHPYEEIAYDLYPVEQKPTDQGIVRGLGYGFWGEISPSPSFSDLLTHVRKAFSVKGLIHSGAEPKSSSSPYRIAFVAGKGAAFLNHAAALECNVFITGEAGYHGALASARGGMAVLELGHSESEFYFPQVMGDWLSQIGLTPHLHRLPTQRIIC